MGSIQARLGRLTQLSDLERDELREDLLEAFEAADRADDTDAMEAAIMGVEKIKMHGEIAEQVAAEAAAAASAVGGDGDDGGDGSDGGDGNDSDADDALAEPAAAAKPASKSGSSKVAVAPAAAADVAAGSGGSAEAGAAETAPTASAEEKEEPSVASTVVEVDSEGDRQPVLASAISVIPLAGADIPGVTAGSAYDNIDQVNMAMVSKINSIRGSHGGDNEKRTVVSLHASIGEDRQLSNADTNTNMKLIEEVTSPKALTASGGYCAPLPVNYDIFGVGVSDRPVRDSLPTFGATRGGIRFVTPPVLGAYTGAISLWTAANDADPTSPATKPNLAVTCASEVSATTNAVTLSLTFGNLMSRAFPELVQRHNQLALIQHARFAEQQLISSISTQSTAVTSPYVLGTGRDMFRAVARAGAAYRNRNRVPPTIMLRAILPIWVQDAMREDIASNFHVEDLAVADATMTAWFNARGINITWHLDDTFSSQSANTPLVDFPTTINWLMFAEGTFLFLDGGTLDLGVVRDSTLVSTNDYVTFVETFEGIAKVGIDSLSVASVTSIGTNTAFEHITGVQTVAVTGSPTGGTFTLTFNGQTTSAIAYNATAATVQAALVALNNIGANDVVVTGAAGGTYTVVFTGVLGNQPVPAMTATSSLTGGTSPGITVTVVQAGQ